MGIPSYFSHFVRQHRKIIKQIHKNTQPIHNLYLDCNSFIYEGVHSGLANNNEELLIQYVCDKLIYYISLLKPQKNVFIAFDGVAPVAKLNQQRKRRYLSWFQSKTLNVIESVAKAVANAEVEVEVEPKAVPWNTSAITPGTLFMTNLAVAIKKRFTNPQEFGLEAFIISCADEVGEGEHKIFEYIRAHPAFHKATNTVIYGLDADLIMLTLNHLHISDHLFLFRETPEFIKSIDNTLNPNELYLLDIPEFGRSIIADFTVFDAAFDTTAADTAFSKANLNKIHDYIFLFFLLGNDFLPHFPALNIRTRGIELLLNAYKLVLNAHHLTLTNDGTICWKNFRLLIDYLQAQELPNIQHEYAQRAKVKPGLKHTQNCTPEMKLLNLPMTVRATEKYINPPEVGWEARYYQTLFDVRIDDERRQEICANYLAGLEWTFKYYSTGCVDWRWTYKYDYPPLLADLIKFIPYFDRSFFLPEALQNKPVSAVVQLSYVLPKQSLYLIPGPVGATLLHRWPEWYVDDCEFQWAFCKYFWEAHIKLPEIDIDELARGLL
jgi:5'-3' exoribonuclease 1